jgi:hypothetical protein
LLFIATGYRLQASGYKLQATGFRLQAPGFRLQAGKEMHHMSRRFCSQNSAKTAKIAPNSLPLTTFALKITNRHRISGLPKTMVF